MLAVILTGGRSSRMGRDKALLPWGGREMSLTLAARYRETLGAVAMAVDRPGRFPIGDALELPDAFPD